MVSLYCSFCGVLYASNYYHFVCQCTVCAIMVLLVHCLYILQVIVATAISAGFSLHEKRNIIIVDHIPTG